MQTELELGSLSCVQKPYLPGDRVRIPAGVTYINNTGGKITTKKPKQGMIVGIPSCDIQAYQIVFECRTLIHGCILPADVLRSI
jgi:hypothetical protein